MGSLGWLIVIAYYGFTDNLSPEKILDIVAFILTSIATISYVVWTKFGIDRQPNELDKLTNENKILQKQFEQKQIKEKLKE